MMDQILSFALRLMLVRDVQTVPGITTVQFTSGVRATLSGDAKDFGYYVRLAYRSKERQHPIAADIRNGSTIVRLARADNDFVGRLSDGGDEVTVWFQGHDGAFHLLRKHPEFQRVADVLRRAHLANSRVWFATSGQAIIEDVMLGSEN